MDNDVYIILIYKNLKGEISPPESARLQEWLDSNPEHQEIERNLRMDWELSGNYEPQIMVDDIDLDEEYAKLQNRIQADEPTEEAVVKSIPQSRSSGSWMKYAAAVALLLVVTFVLFQQFADTSIPLATLESNEKIETVTLPDGTQVTLNHHSQLSYPEQFADGQRKIYLEGEAFFDVTHDAQRPFIIETPSALTTVLGTSFNLEDYPDQQQSNVSVYSGKVKFESLEKENEVAILAKGHWAGLSKGEQKITTRITDNFNADAWRSKTMTFKNVPLELVVRDLENHFQVEIQLCKELKDRKYNSRLNLNKTDLKEILDNITTAYDATLLEKGNRYTIDLPNCQ